MPAHYETVPAWDEQQVKSTLPTRSADGHKGSFGTGLLIAGTRDMPGAALLAGLGAMRSGLGKLEIATESEVIPMILPSLPEATYIRNIEETLSTNNFKLDAYKAIAIGPGKIPDSQMEQNLMKLFESAVPVILDAGALSKRTYPIRNAPTILTPHPGEFSRISGIPVEQIAKDKAQYAKRLAKELDATIVLKGPKTVIAFPDGEAWTNPTGNSALSKGGTGDTLTGMMLGMLCCHDNWKHAVLNAVYLHGACAEHWTKTKSPHTLLAHELSSMLPEVWKSLEGLSSEE